VAGYFAALSNSGVFLDLNERTDLGLAPNFATIQIDKLRKLYAFPKFDVIRDEVIGVHK
jgi:hypothetical protein